MRFRRVRKMFEFLQRTPLHPQWLLSLHNGKKIQLIRANARGVVLDIGCATQWPRAHLRDCEYIGLDNWQIGARLYAAKPAVFADAHRLPFKTASIDTVLLLDVLEHLGSPDLCLAESARVLQAEGVAIIAVPFLYPLHDEPFDFNRWTEHGLRELASRNCLEATLITPLGHPLETAALMMNLSLAKTALTGIREKRPTALLALAAPILIPLANIVAVAFARMAGSDSMMPSGYLAVFERSQRSA